MDKSCDMKSQVMKWIEAYKERGNRWEEYRCYRDWETDRKSTRLNSSHSAKSRMPSSA